MYPKRPVQKAAPRHSRGRLCDFRCHPDCHPTAWKGVVFEGTDRDGDLAETPTEWAQVRQ
jgi:hypothetical protein